MKEGIDLRDRETLRRYLAGEALSGYLSAFVGEEVSWPDPEKAARQVVKFADAVATELERTA